MYKQNWWYFLFNKLGIIIMMYYQLQRLRKWKPNIYNKVRTMVK